jgi:hypothetical protein
MLVRTKMRPWELVEVDDSELLDLQRMDLVLEDWSLLYVDFQAYQGGEHQDVTGLTLTIKNASNATVLTASGAQIQHLETGRYFYRWLAQDQPGPGTYTANWAATDSTGNPVTASESVTIS